MLFLTQRDGLLPNLNNHRAGSTVKGRVFLILHKGAIKALPPNLKLFLGACFRAPSFSSITLPSLTTSPGSIWKSKDKGDQSMLLMLQDSVSPSSHSSPSGSAGVGVLEKILWPNPTQPLPSPAACTHAHACTHTKLSLSDWPVINCPAG